MNSSVDLPGAPQLKLRFDVRLEDLYRRDGLLKLDTAFVDFLGREDPALREQLVLFRQHGHAALTPKQESQFLIEVAIHLDKFVAELFNIEDEVASLAERHSELAPLYSCKRLFVQRRAANTYKAEAAAGFDGARLEAQLVGWFGTEFSELEFARRVTAWLKDEVVNAERLAVHCATPPGPYIRRKEGKNIMRACFSKCPRNWTFCAWCR